MASRSLLPFIFGGSPAERQGGQMDPFLQLHREMNRLFDDVFRGYTMPATGAAGEAAPSLMTPRMDVTETDGEIKICAELPGVSEKDIEVTLDNDVLTIRGEKKAESEKQQENYHVMERSFGSFARSLRLPYPVNPDQVKASFENGVLTVNLPKPQHQQQKSRRIEVKSGQSRPAAGGGNIGVDRAAAGDKPGAGGEAQPSVTQRAPDEGEVASGQTVGR